MNIKKICLGALIVSVLSLVAVFNLTNPSSFGPAGVLLVFMLIFTILFLSSFFILNGLILVLNYFRRTLLKRKLAIGLLERKKLFYSLDVALVLTMAISLRSVGSLSLYSISLLVVLGSLAGLFIKKRL